MLRVGHKGADAVVPGNTRASFEAALALGVDMIEFDVLRAADGRLVIAHDFEDAERAEALELADALDHLADAAYARLELDVDLKLPGYEREVVEALDRRGMDARALVSTVWAESLDRLGELRPGLRRGWSVPRARRDYTQGRATALPAHVDARLRPPGAAPAGDGHAPRRPLRGGHGLPPPRDPRAARGGAPRGRPALRVDRRRGRALRRLRTLGVDGVITNDPRLFAG